MEFVRLREEVPAKDGAVFRGASWAVFVHWSFESHPGVEVHFQRLERDLGVGDCEEDGAGHESAGRLGCGAVKHEWWRLHVDCHFRRLRRSQSWAVSWTAFRWGLGAANAHGQAVALVLAVIFPEEIHDRN